MNSPLFGVADPVSTATHLLGAMLGLALARPLVCRATRASGRRACLWVFALSAVFLLAMSALFHVLPRGTLGRDVAQRLDHAGIFILIAGTFTAGHGLFFHGFWRWGMTALIWTVGIVGLTVKVVFFHDISEGVGLLLYLAMGWLGLLAMVKLALERDWRPAGQLFAGGLVYTAGAVGEFFGGDSLSLVPGIVGSHEVFHLAVLGGLAIHWQLFHEAATWQGASPFPSRISSRSAGLGAPDSPGRTASVASSKKNGYTGAEATDGR